MIRCRRRDLLDSDVEPEIDSEYVSGFFEAREIRPVSGGFVSGSSMDSLALTHDTPPGYSPYVVHGTQ